MSEFEVINDPVLGEEIWLTKTSKGLPLRVLPSQRFAEIAAVVSVGYGSTDLGFDLDGEHRRSPEGVAHYLEHKLFEDEDLHVFERFGQRGADVNAMTGFTRTTYYFTATSMLEENLDDLLTLVAKLHVTDENVEKERGIIAQEIRMYEDSPEYRGFFDLLRCFYGEHPVRNPVGGTVESIQGIDVEELEACHRAFYRTGNAALAVAGPVDPKIVLELAEAWELPQGEAPKSHFPEDLAAVLKGSGKSEMAVARPRLLLGFKDRDLVEDPLERRDRQMHSQIILDRILGGSSEIREDLHQRGLLDDSLSASYMGERSFGFTVLACETEDPEKLAGVLKEVLMQPLDIDEEHLERARRRALGQYVRSFDSLSNLAFGQGEEALEGIKPFGLIERLEKLNCADLLARHEEMFREDSYAMVVVGG
ncbi:MAG: EF-P 5-aminopentanol modification-associated protein YfmH [Planctomycetota bacterium]|jgi:predicted Zn-dependent peptidase